jgi:hypothetical protein
VEGRKWRGRKWLRTPRFRSSCSVKFTAYRRCAGALLIRSILSTAFDEATWPTAKPVLARALTMEVGAGGLVELNAAARRLCATLGFLQLPPRSPELRLLHYAFGSGA